VAALAALVACAAGRARAQDNPAVREAVRLAGEGRGDDARHLVNAELAKARVGDPSYVEALYWRARLAVSGDSAERDLRRIAIEFPTSNWADDALLQLTQLAMAAGNPVSAFALAQRLRSDYPESDLRAQAALWAGRAAFDLGDARGACSLLDSARTEGTADVEFTNRVAFYRARCSTLPAAPPAGAAPTPPQPVGGAPAGADTARSQPAAPAAAQRAPRPTTAPAANPHPSAAPPPGWSGSFSIQVAAVKTDAEARRVLRRLEGAGFTGRVATGTDRFRRIRVGAYATEREALDALPTLQRVTGGRPFVVRGP
jgi:hypothetical protein